ncbi:gamma carbonic anhydrase family protein [Ruania alba]|uniref:Carbonic anhydrase or acetyltransferase, isoleucine patch superfamily n=1 Tax=Ruania alba TaxID=648782 RepID=A0A1H5MEQ6_9MICO|nr:gamma carbonic anhydrase family protein [Ruania alba]SEE87785.1 Carbonic anhydrase or acetyltransferase, isoleucine patch superfamily [Ruania alba]
MSERPWQLGSAVPHVHPEAWLAPGCVVIGDVTLGAHASIWYGAVVRADQEEIAIGDRSNLQDGVVAHSDPGIPLRVGAGVTVGHNAVLHGCQVDDGVLIGMGARLLNGSSVGAGSLVAAGALVPEGMTIPAGVLAVGAPAKVRRDLTEEEVANLRRSAGEYVSLAHRHRQARRVAPADAPPQ